MSSVQADVQRQLFQAASEAGVIDPIAGGIPQNEIELNAILGLYHQLRLVDWARVPMIGCDDNPGPSASDVIPSDAVIGSEYPLAAADPAQVAIWGGMPADLLILSRDRSVTLIENKIGSGFTYGADAKTGQIGRQIDYLRSTRPQRKAYILLVAGSLVDRGWYLRELTAASQCDRRNESVGIYLMRWEDVFASIRSPC